MKIKSRTDLITNSSSEVFIVKSHLEKKELKKILSGFSCNGVPCSGMGGIIEILEKPYVPENRFMIEVDNNYYDLLIEYLEKLGIEKGEDVENLRDTWYIAKINEATIKMENSKNQKELIENFEELEKLETEYREFDY